MTVRSLVFALTLLSACKTSPHHFELQDTNLESPSNFPEVVQLMGAKDDNDAQDGAFEYCNGVALTYNLMLTTYQCVAIAPHLSSAEGIQENLKNYRVLNNGYEQSVGNIYADAQSGLALVRLRSTRFKTSARISSESPSTEQVFTVAGNGPRGYYDSARLNLLQHPEAQIPADLLTLIEPHLRAKFIDIHSRYNAFIAGKATPADTAEFQRLSYILEKLVATTDLKTANVKITANSLNSPSLIETATANLKSLANTWTELIYIVSQDDLDEDSQSLALFNGFDKGAGLFNQKGQLVAIASEVKITISANKYSYAASYLSLRAAAALSFFANAKKAGFDVPAFEVAPE